MRRIINTIDGRVPRMTRQQALDLLRRETSPLDLAFATRRSGRYRFDP